LSIGVCEEPRFGGVFCLWGGKMYFRLPGACRGIFSAYEIERRCTTQDRHLEAITDPLRCSHSS
ncbi:hypothetical protein, partial [Pseudomonas faucium]|uniref:hypothetical protein n=1 Tax=Pseudomonas faucium TaxID=2740518 RepID=UPI001F35FD4B